MKIKLYTIHENPEREDPADRVEFVREGFSLGGFLFSIFWLLYHRLWLPALAYLVLLGTLAYMAEVQGFSEETVTIMQLVLQAMLGTVAFDLKRWALGRQGYRMAGVVAAENPIQAGQRYYDVLA
jgi:hypothetical protein